MIFVLFMFILRPAGFWRPYWGHWALCLGISQFQPWRLYSQQIEGGIIRSPLILIPSPFQSSQVFQFRWVVSKISRLLASLLAVRYQYSICHRCENWSSAPVLIESIRLFGRLKVVKSAFQMIHNDSREYLIDLTQKNRWVIDTPPPSRLGLPRIPPVSG